MPVFHKYSSNYHKSGYYVNVNWSAPHPYPLQTPAITEQIYREFGFEPGDNVPNELTSRLFNAGLHWTEGNGTGNPQQQTNLNPISDADFPELDLDQLNSVYELLESVENDVEGQTVNTGSIDELRSQLDKLRNQSNSGRSTIDVEDAPDQIAPLISDILGEEVDQKEADRLQDEAEFPRKFSQSLNQFVRDHPITPQNVAINDHGDPSYRFQSGSVEWELADCRPKNLDFDWAVTISPEATRRFGIRVTSDGIVRIVHQKDRLSEQQAADLITIVPCLVWLLDILDGYPLHDHWNGSGIQNELPSPHQDWFGAQIRSAVSALDLNQNPTEGVIIDNPGRYFARVRSVDRSIVCVPVSSLPDSAEIGTEVTFETTVKYGSLYAKEITGIEIKDPERREIRIQDDDKEYSVQIPHPQEAATSKALLRTLRAIFDTISPAAALSNEPVQELANCLGSAELNESDKLLGVLLEHTPFDPNTFPKIVDEIHTHKQIPDEAGFQLVPLTFSVAVFYDVVDSKAVIEQADQQGDTTVLYQRDGEILVVGQELLWHSVSEPLAAIPDQLRKSITKTEHGRLIVDLLPSTIAALSERQFYASRPSGDAFVNQILRNGAEDVGVHLLYLASDD